MPYNDGDCETRSTPDPSRRHQQQHRGRDDEEVDPSEATVIDVERMDDDEDDMDDMSSNDSRQPAGSGLNRQNGGGHSDKASKSARAAANRNPTCALCKNHRISSPLRGHKRYCPFARCPCEQCGVTRKKQKINAAQVATRRAVQQDRELGLDRPQQPGSTSQSGSSTPRTFGSSPLPEPSNGHNNNNNNKPVQPAPPRPVRPSVIASSSSSTSSSLPLPGSSTSAPTGLHHSIPTNAPPATPPAAGPALIGENIWLGCYLLGRNSSLLANSFRISRLSGEQLACLEREVWKTMNVVRGEIAVHLKDIHTYLEDRLLREQQREQPQYAGPIKPTSYSAQLHHHPAFPFPSAYLAAETMAAAAHHHHFHPHLHHKTLSPVDPYIYPAYSSLLAGHPSSSTAATFRDGPAPLYAPFGTQ